LGLVVLTGIVNVLRLLRVLIAKALSRRVGLAHDGDVDGVVCATLFFKAYPNSTFLLIEPYEVRSSSRWNWFNWFNWDYVADLPKPAKVKLYVDHHPTNMDSSPFYDPTAPSAAQLAIKALSLQEDMEMVKLVELANECDTASITSPEAWELNDAVKGARGVRERVKLAKWLSKEGLKALERPEVKAWISVNRERRKRTSELADRIPLRSLVFVEVDEEVDASVRNLTITLENRGVNFVCVVTPHNGRFKVHLGCRKDSGLDCAKIAAKLGGGGHRYAAASTVNDLNKALSLILQELGLKQTPIYRVSSRGVKEEYVSVEGGGIHV